MKQYIKQGYYPMPISSQSRIYTFFRQISDLLYHEEQDSIARGSVLTMFATRYARLTASEDRDVITLSNRSFVIKYVCTTDTAYFKGLQDFVHVENVIAAINRHFDRNIFNREDAYHTSLSELLIDRELITALNELGEKLIKSDALHENGLYTIYYTEKCSIAYLSELAIILIESPMNYSISFSCGEDSAYATRLSEIERFKEEIISSIKFADINLSTLAILDCEE